MYKRHTYKRKKKRFEKVKKVMMNIERNKPKQRPYNPE